MEDKSGRDSHIGAQWRTQTRIKKRKREMLKYLIETNVNGIKIDLIQSAHGFAVIYGMERKTYILSDRKLAFKSYRECLNHALESEYA